MSCTRLPHNVAQEIVMAVVIIYHKILMEFMPIIFMSPEIYILLNHILHLYIKFWIFNSGDRRKRSLNVKADLHDLDKLALYKNNYYPTDDEISRLDKLGRLGMHF